MADKSSPRPRIGGAGAKDNLAGKRVEPDNRAKCTENKADLEPSNDDLLNRIIIQADGYLVEWDCAPGVLLRVLDEVVGALQLFEDRAVTAASLRRLVDEVEASDPIGRDDAPGV